MYNYDVVNLIREKYKNIYVYWYNDEDSTVSKGYVDAVSLSDKTIRLRMVDNSVSLLRGFVDDDQYEAVRAELSVLQLLMV